MKQTEETQTPEEYRTDLLDEKSMLNKRLAMIKAEIANAFMESDHSKVADLRSEKADVVAELSEIDIELRQLKQELPHRTSGLHDLHLVVDLVAAQIAKRGVSDIDAAIAMLNTIKVKLTPQQ